MAVTSVKRKLPGGRTGSLDERAQRNYVEHWVVITDDAKDGVQVVGDATGLPKLFDPYIALNDIDVGSRVKRITPTETESPYVWDVEVEYDSKLHDDAKGNRNPLLRPADLSVTFENYTRAATMDNEGNPFVNALGDEFDPPIEQDDERTVLNVARNEATFDLGFAMENRSIVNSDVWLGFQPGEARLKILSATEEFEAEIGEFWRVSYSISLKENRSGTQLKANYYLNGETQITLVEGWDTVILNTGYYELVDNKRKHIEDDNGNKIVQPVRLDQNGATIAPTAPRSDSVYYVYRDRIHKPFAPFNLP